MSVVRRPAYNHRKPLPEFRSDWLNQELAAIERAIKAQYETGPFTPGVTFSTPGDVAATYGATNAGTYFRHGSLVTFSLMLDVSSLTFTTASGFLKITGLPYAATSGSLRFSGSVLFHGATLTYSAGVTWLALNIVPGATYMAINQNKSATSTANITTANLTTGNALALQLSGTYLTDE